MFGCWTMHTNHNEHLRKMKTDLTDMVGWQPLLNGICLFSAMVHSFEPTNMMVTTICLLVQYPELSQISHLFCLREVPLFTHEESKYSNRNGNVIKSMVSTNAVIYSNANEMKILVEISIFDNQQLNIWVFSCNRCVYAVWHDAVRWIGCHIKRYKRPTVLIFTGQMWYFKRLLWLIQ